MNTVIICLLVFKWTPKLDHWKYNFFLLQDIKLIMLLKILLKMKETSVESWVSMSPVSPVFHTEVT